MNPDKTKFIDMMRSEFVKDKKLSFADLFSPPFTDDESVDRSKISCKNKKMAKSLEPQIA